MRDANVRTCEDVGTGAIIMGLSRSDKAQINPLCEILSNSAGATSGLSQLMKFDDVEWTVVPGEPGVYVIYDLDEVVYVGMAGRNGRGSLRKRLKDHSTGQVVNMFAQYLFLARVQFQSAERITHPRAAKSACHGYIRDRCSFRFKASQSGSEARDLEGRLRLELNPAFNPAS